MSELADRYNEGKLEWSLVHFPSFAPMVKVLMFGAKKYSPHNWKKGLSVTKTIDSLIRHVVALSDREDMDSESQLEHIGHIMCNAMFLSYMLKNKPDMDDRYNDINYNKTKEVITTEQPFQTNSTAGDPREWVRSY